MILSENVKLKLDNSNISTNYIENYLKEQFGSVIRWAIIEAESDYYLISVSYNEDRSY